MLIKDFPGKADNTFVNPGYTSMDELIRTFNEKASEEIALYNIYLKAYRDNGSKDEGLSQDILNYQIYANVSLVDMRFSDPNSGSLLSDIMPFLALAVLALVAFIMFRNINASNRSTMNFSKSKARLNSNLKVRFADVAGADEEKAELVEIVEFLKNPRKFEQVGARIPKGVLLVGPPGTGKTLFAKAVAGEANVPFFAISGSDFVEMFVGVGASRVRDLFDDAKKNMPCIIFIDEIDAVGRRRGAGLGGGHDEREQTLNQLLVQMDGFEPNSGIIVMAATNRADILDPALLRPGRFDRQIQVHLPDVRGREEIFKVHSRNKPLASDIDFKQLGRMTSGFSGADIENLLNEAAILAARDSRTVINKLDIDEAIIKVVMGPQKKPYCYRSRQENYRVSRSGSRYCGRDASELRSDTRAMTMGGRAAEEIVIKDISSGASGDIKMATNSARQMITEWGMSTEIGPVYLGSADEVFLGRDYQSANNYSEEVAARIDKEIRRIVEEGHQTALKILNENRDLMDRMVRLLIEKETIYAEEVQSLIAGKDLKIIEQELDDRIKQKAESVKNAVSKDKVDDISEPSYRK
ncbi:metalloprotease m41 ftsh [Holotrichia oblita]|nr:metalloprotease m41 ftsh [Holotrichia oblita]